jgi:hypothetical protein
MAIFSAYANDEGYENVFSQQLNNLLNPKDVVIAISASGNSPNVIQGVELANQRGAITIAFTGMTGGKLKDLANVVVHIPSMRIEQVEDVHLMLEHMICNAVVNGTPCSRRVFWSMPVEPVRKRMIGGEPLGMPAACPAANCQSTTNLFTLISKEFRQTDPRDAHGS